MTKPLQLFLYLPSFLKAEPLRWRPFSRESSVFNSPILQWRDYLKSDQFWELLLCTPVWRRVWRPMTSQGRCVTRLQTCRWSFKRCIATRFLRWNLRRTWKLQWTTRGFQNACGVSWESARAVDGFREMLVGQLLSLQHQWTRMDITSVLSGTRICTYQVLN